MGLSEWPEKFRDDNAKQDAVEVQIDAEVTAVTDKAVCFDGELWLPKSQCPQLRGAKVGDYFQTVDMPPWMAKHKGLGP